MSLFSSHTDTPHLFSIWHSNHSLLKFRAVRIFLMLMALFAFIISLQLMASSFTMAGSGLAKELVSVGTNPFTSLFIGLLATAVVQSSSATTSIIVSIVAVGGLTVEQATPMIMGANIGTALTSTIVALGYIGHRKEFEGAVAVASLHDFFNIITVSVLFGVEISTHALSETAVALAEQFALQEGSTLKPFLFWVQDSAEYLVSMLAGVPYLALPIGLLALFLSLRLLTQTLQWLVIGRVQQRLNHMLFARPWRGLFSGMVMTMGLQSSSLATSLMVPLVATDKVSLRRAFPVIMGANVGTTTTALFAALVTTSVGGTAGLAVAFTHLLFNLFGVILLFPIPRLQHLPIWLAGRLGKLCCQNRLYGVVYAVGVFFVLPFALIVLVEGLNWLG